MNDPIRVMIVDDTVTYRKILSRVIESFDNTQLIGTASNGAIALQKIKKDKPDLVLLDIVMPEMDGVATLKELHELHPDIGVVMVSSQNREDADITVKALHLGATDFVPKPNGRDMEENFQELRKKLKPIITLFITKKYTRIVKGMMSETRSAVAPEGLKTKPEPKSLRPGDSIDLIAIGVSTGGPKVLMKLFSELDKNIPVPIVLVQHMPPVFTASLAEHITKVAGFPVVEANEGMLLEPGTAYIAPGGHHMEIRRQGRNYTAVITDGAPVHSCRPSVDVLFESIAEHFKGNVLALILTGMGRDGAEGVKALKEKADGVICLAQSEISCIVYGMPKAVVDAGLADEVVDSTKLGKRINRIVENNS